MAEAIRSAFRHPAQERDPKLPNSTHFAKSATRALEVVELFGTVRRPLRASEIRTALALHPSSTHQLLDSLAKSGFLVFDDFTKMYYPSLRLLQFGSWIAASTSDFQALGDLVAALRNKTCSPVVVSTRFRNKMQVVAHSGAPDMPSWVAEGVDFPLFNSISGLALLASRSDHEVHWIANRHRLKASQMGAEREVLTRVSAIRNLGYSSGKGYGAVSGSWALAMTLPRSFAGIPLVVGLCDVAGRLKGQEANLSKMMRQEIEATLGCGASQSTMGQH